MEDAATVICVLLVLIGVGSGLYILKRAAEAEQHDAAMSRKIEELEARNATHLARRNSPHAPTAATPPARRGCPGSSCSSFRDSSER